MCWKRSLIPLLAAVLLITGAGVSPADDRFQDNGDGTLTDHHLGLMWAKTDNQGDIDWEGARRWARITFPLSLPAGKQEGWRLPTLEELRSLYLKSDNYQGYEADCGQRVFVVPEIELSCSWVWTAERRSITARVFNFQRGYHYTDRAVHSRGYRALPVRDLVP
jgi:hypothetical protein